MTVTCPEDALLIIVTIDIFDNQITGARVKSNAGAVATTNGNIRNFKAFDDNVVGSRYQRTFTQTNAPGKMGAFTIAGTPAQQM